MQFDEPVFEKASLTWGDCVRYFIALYVAGYVFFLAISLSAEAPANAGFATTTIGDTAVSMLWNVGTLAGGVLLGHALPSLLRGRVSLTLSSVLTWVGLSLLIGAASGFGGESPVLDHAMFAGLALAPVIVVAHVLRLVVPALRPRVDGRPARYVMGSAAQ